MHGAYKGLPYELHTIGMKNNQEPGFLIENRTGGSKEATRLLNRIKILDRIKDNCPRKALLVKSAQAYGLMQQEQIANACHLQREEEAGRSL